MTRVAIWVVVTWIASVSVTARAGTPTDDFFDWPMWSDGKAEVNLYDATEVRYGKARTANEATLIFVKEDHRGEDLVKADNPRNGDLPALKLNWVVSVPTGIYTYRQQASVFINRETNEPFRETFASHEWCGNTFKDLRRRNKHEWRYSYSSYFGSEGDGEKTLAPSKYPPKAQVLVDALPAFVRALQKKTGATVELAAVPTLWSNKANPAAMELIDIQLRVVKRETVTVPAGTFQAWRVEATYPDGGRDVYHVADDDARRLLHMTRADGAVYKLRKSLRVAYWQLNNPGDQKLKEGSGIRR